MSWRPTRQLWIIACLYVAAIAFVAIRPERWSWALAFVLAFNVPIVFATLRPRSKLLGPNLTHLSAASVARGEIALTFDDGPDPEVTPAVLDLLDAHDVKATFFCVAQTALVHPDLCRQIIRRGHRVGNHSMRHRLDFALLGPLGYVRELDMSQRTLEHLTGIRPAFFRAPAGFRNPFLWSALAQHDMTLVSWTRRGFDTRIPDPDVVLRRLTHNLAAGDILLLHDGHCARTARGVPVVIEVLPPLLAAIRSAGLSPVPLAQ